MNKGRLFVIILIALLVVVFVGSIVAVVALLRGGGGEVEEGSTLVLHLGGALPEQPQPEQPFSGMPGRALSMFEVDTGLTRAAIDDDVKQLLVYIEPLGIGFGKISELRDVLGRFSTTSGKPITCWMEAASNKEYLLSTACDRVYMAPEGFFLVNGLHLGVTFFKGTLDKLGVKAEFTRHGKYKSAVEPMISTEMSEPVREMMNSLADALFQELVSSIARRRKLSEVAVRAIIDDPPLTARAALAAGLIDGLYYEDQLMDEVAGKALLPERLAATGDGDAAAPGDDDDSAPAPAAADDDDSAPALAAPGDDDSAPALAVADDDDSAPALAAADDDDSAPAVADDDDSAVSVARVPRNRDEDGPPEISLAAYLQRAPRGGSGGKKVGVIFCEGQITSGKSRPGRSMGSDTIAAAIRKARKDSEIGAIVLRIDSPGGSGLASDIIWREVELARKEDHKPVVVSMSDLAASGGYYIAMGADAIVAQPTTLTGSIGVFAGKYDLSGLYEKVGLTTSSIKRGEYSDLFVLSKGLGEKGTLKLEQFVDSFYATFIDKAAEGRGTTAAAIDAVAQGRVWTGAQALEVGLVDALGSLRTAVALAKEKASLDSEAKLVLYPKLPSFWESLLQGDSPLLRSTSPLDELRQTAEALGPLLDPSRGMRALLEAAPLLSSGQPLVMLPYDLDVR